MTNRKKVNTLDLIKQMTQKNRETLNAVENLKQERSPSTGITDVKQHFGPKSVKKEPVDTMPREKEPRKSDDRKERYQVGLKKLGAVLESEAFRDKKEIFTWSLSGDCLSKYEKLATAISYKMGIRTSRNQLMRKVLEDFIHREYGALIKEIELK